MSQVKNLRAMFENKGEPATSPPDRGRSPGVGSTGTESPRPLSKVRTSFIAVEKDGRIGLRRDHSGESSLSRRRMSNETEGESAVATQEATTVTTTMTPVDEPARSFRTHLAMKEPPIPESPRQEDDSKRDDKMDTQAKKRADSTKSSSKAFSASTSAEFQPPSKAANGSSSGSTAAHYKTGLTGLKSAASGSRPARLTTTAPNKETSKTAAKSPSAMNKPLASPVARDGKSPKPSGTATTAKKPASGTVAKQTAAGHSKQTSTTGLRKSPPMTVPPSGLGFVKPKPKSPTKPAKLPASLMAPTRASVSKVNPAKAAPGQSSTLQAFQAVGRSPSRASISTTTSTIQRQPSGTNRQRPSLGPPPKKTVEEKPAHKKDVDVDEGFLARMMRPTHSSQSKTSEKVPVTPPRKGTARRPMTRDGEDSGKRDGSVRKPLSARKPNSVTIVPPVSPTTAVATAVEMAKEVAEVETAEEGITIARKADTTQGFEDLVTDSAAEQAVAPIAGSGEPKADDNKEAAKGPKVEVDAEVACQTEETVIDDVPAEAAANIEAGEAAAGGELAAEGTHEDVPVAIVENAARVDGNVGEVAKGATSHLDMQSHDQTSEEMDEKDEDQVKDEVEADDKGGHHASEEMRLEPKE